MKTLPLNNGYKASVDDEDYAVASQFKWIYHKGSMCAVAWHSGASVYLGRVILNIPMGDTRIVRYRNGDKLDNRKTNLTISSKSEILNEALRRSRERKNDERSAANHRSITDLLSTWGLPKRTISET